MNGFHFRIHQPRQHKKASFAIINEFTPTQSRAPSPTSNATGRVSPFRGRGFKPPAGSRVSSRAVSPQYLDVEAPTVEELMRPTTVQFNTKTYTDKQIDLGGASSGVGPRGILQKRLADTLFNDTEASYQDREMESYEIQTDLKHKTLIQIASRNDQSLPVKPFSVLPEKMSASVAPSPAPRRKFYNSTGDLRAKSKETQKPPINPRSYHKGLLRVVSSANTSPSKIPRRQSITASADNLSTSRRRSSISPNRRLSNAQSSIIDLGIMASSSNQSSRSGSRISKPTMLSPIIGTPNKDSAEQSAQEEEPNGEVHVNGASPIMSPSRIPMRSGSSTNLMSRTNSGMNLKSQNSSNVNSRNNSRSGSREPSPGMSLLRPGMAVQATKPFMRKGSNRTSSNNKTGGMLETNKSVLTKSSDPSKLRSSIRKAPVVRKENDSKGTIKRDPIKKDSSYLKKLPVSTFKRESSNLKREPSNLKRDPPNLKREPSNLRREPSNLRREPSNLRRETSNLKREGSTIRRGDTAATSQSNSTTLKRQTSKLMMASVLSKNNSDSMLNKRLEKKNSFKNEKRKTTSESDGAADETTTTTTTTTIGTNTTTGTNTNPTDSKGNSMEKLIPMTASNVVSMTTAAIAAQPVQITTAVTNSTGSLSKTNSSNQLIGATTGQNTSDASGTATILSPASTILEKSQKTLENIQKTVTEATDEIQRTIDENLTDLKSLEHDMKMEEAKMGGTGAISAGSSATTAAAQQGSALVKKASTKTLLDKVNEALDPIATDATKSDDIITPIEATVSVIEKDGRPEGGHSNRLSDGSERASEKSVSSMPDKVQQSVNGTDKQSGDLNGSEKDANNRINDDG